MASFSTPACCSSPVFRRLAASLVAVIIFYTLYYSSSASPKATYPGGSRVQLDQPVLTIDAKPEETTAPPPPPKNPFPRRRISDDLQKTLKWEPPTGFTDHYPSYYEYNDRDYDPNRWEGFPQNTKLFLNSSERQLRTPQDYPHPYNPVLADDTRTVQKAKEHLIGPCDGPHGHILGNDEKDVISAYKGLPQGFPQPSFGSFSALGLDDQACFDRYSRLGPYGINETDESAHQSMIKFNWNNVRWGDLQNRCMLKNQARFKNKETPALKPGTIPAKPAGDAIKKAREKAQRTNRENRNNAPEYKPRTAVLIRTWSDYEYQENDMHAIRSLITELNLQSGGQYHVFLFVHVKDNNIPIFTDEVAYRQALATYVPEEFRDMAILWAEGVGVDWYPKIGEWSAYYQQFMPLQWFSNTHPEFDFVWNWEMDARYIGHHHHFLQQITNFAKAQPRKYLWEINARYYIPEEHGDYEAFRFESNRLVEASKSHTKPVWGPQTWHESQKTFGPSPPTSEDEDNFDWGVGEEADFISLLPIWDPRHTRWSQRDVLFNFPASPESNAEDPWPHIPRRVFINTLSRLSKDLLHAMHFENSAGLAMCSEMWPATTALHHGFKAVYAPHPIWMWNEWPAKYLDDVFNADGWGAGSFKNGHTVDDGRGAGYEPELERQGLPQNGTGPNREGKAARWGQEGDSPYNADREHNFAGFSWYYWTDLPRVIYWRWLGWKAGYRIVTIRETPRVVDALGLAGGAEWENEHGRMCLPSMLLHPVKNVRRATADELASDAASISH